METASSVWEAKIGMGKLCWRYADACVLKAVTRYQMKSSVPFLNNIEFLRRTTSNLEPTGRITGVIPLLGNSLCWKLFRLHDGFRGDRTLVRLVSCQSATGYWLWVVNISLKGINTGVFKKKTAIDQTVSTCTGSSREVPGPLPQCC